jgi:hypothetical protein
LRETRVIVIIVIVVVVPAQLRELIPLRQLLREGFLRVGFLLPFFLLVVIIFIFIWTGSARRLQFEMVAGSSSGGSWSVLVGRRCSCGCGGEEVGIVHDDRTSRNP